MPYDVIVSAPDFSGSSGAVVIYDIFDTSGNYIDYSFVFIVPTPTMIFDDIKPLVSANIAAYFSTKGYGSVGNVVWYTPSSAASYQTIVSQTGTAAPAVSGGFTPINTLSGIPTMTWARTGAGVYTLTAGSAVFSTTGKTGVFIAPLQNLNASVRGVVTSSTVITFTTAVQSVAVLGLLGLTTTATDALLSQTMIFVQNYA